MDAYEEMIALAKKTGTISIGNGYLRQAVISSFGSTLGSTLAVRMTTRRRATECAAE